MSGRAGAIFALLVLVTAGCVSARPKRHRQTFDLRRPGALAAHGALCGGGGVTRFPSGTSGQLVQQCVCRFQVGRVEAFRERLVDRR